MGVWGAGGRFIAEEQRIFLIGILGAGENRWILFFNIFDCIIMSSGLNILILQHLGSKKKGVEEIRR